MILALTGQFKQLSHEPEKFIMVIIITIIIIIIIIII